MKNFFDHTLPEEREAQFEELTTMLQQAYSKPVSVTPDRQAQILARVRERLGIPDADESVVSQESIDIIAPFSVPPLSEVPRRHRLSRWATLIAAVLVIGALVVTGLLIFQAWTPSTGTQPPTSPPGKPVTAFVPDLKGLSYQEANNTATKAGFQLRSSNGDTSGVVLNQTPAAGNLYTVGLTIEVTMGILTRTVPGNLVNNTLGGAEAILNTANIPFTVINAGQNPSKPPNTVKQVNPASGSTINVGQKVTLYVWNLNSTR
jgi:hypothetical protein